MLEFDAQVVDRMNEIFEGQSCSKCGNPAKRFKVWDHDTIEEHTVYYCHGCFPHKTHVPMMERVSKIYPHPFVSFFGE